MKKQGNDYYSLLFLIGLWVMVIAISQCETNHKLDEISYELRMLRYK